MPLISVVIPTLNEEMYLPRLLACLRRQSCSDIEILVCDAGSSDSTGKVCQKWGVEFLAGGMPGIGRNIGAQRSTAPFIMFVDADVTFGDSFLATAVEYVTQNSLDGISFDFRFDTASVALKIVSMVTSAYFRATTSFGFPHCLGGAFLVRRVAHERIDGFDERITVAEDQDYVRRLCRNHRYSFLDRPRVIISPRRFRQQGIARQILLWIRIEVHRMALGEIQHNRFGYFREG